MFWKSLDSDEDFGYGGGKTMGKSYKTSEVAEKIGIHPNTVRLYEDLQLIPRPERLPNGYRVFTDLHLEQFRLARTALQVEVLQRGLRKKAIEIIKTSAKGEYDDAIEITVSYIEEIRSEQKNGEEAVRIVGQLISGGEYKGGGLLLKRNEAARKLGISMDALRNWELNGLLTVKRRENGYRVYGDEEIRRLKIIRTLRCANYSLAAILRMLNALSDQEEISIRRVIDTPEEDDDIITACDRLITSLKNAECNGRTILKQLHRLKEMEEVKK